MSKPPKPRVVIVGGGFAGLACANNLPAKRFDVTLVDQRSSFEFLPNIHELVSGVKTKEQLRLDLCSALGSAGHTFVNGCVDALNPQKRVVSLRGRSPLSADYLVIAIGGVDQDFGIPGVSRHAHGFKSVNQCAAIHDRLQRLFTSTAKRRRAPSIVIVGAGLEGVEACGEVLRFSTGFDAQIHIVETKGQPLPENGGGVSRHMRELFDIHGITGHWSDSVRSVAARSVTLTSGTKLTSDLTIWTVGAAPHPLLRESGLDANGRWVPVDESLLHPEFRNVFVAGDAAAPPQLVKKQAYNALDMGRCVARNIVRLERAQPLEDFRASAKPQLCAFGDVDTLLLGGGVGIAGPALAPAKEAIYSAVMTQLDRRRFPARLGSLTTRNLRAFNKLLIPALRKPEPLRRAGAFRLLR
ncbi:MAG: FAD-dependent oxidoreductase [Pseudomonadota bacterium]